MIKQYWDYEKCEQKLEEILTAIRVSSYVPDFIAYVNRDGNYMALRFSYVVGIKPVYGFTVMKDGEKRKRITDLNIRLDEKKCLVFDDGLATGDSLAIVADYLRSLGAEDVKTAAFWITEKTKLENIPDYYLERFATDKDVTYFWENSYFGLDKEKDEMDDLGK